MLAKVMSFTDQEIDLSPSVMGEDAASILRKELGDCVTAAKGPNKGHATEILFDQARRFAIDKAPTHSHFFSTEPGSPGKSDDISAVVVQIKDGKPYSSGTANVAKAELMTFKKFAQTFAGDFKDWVKDNYPKLQNNHFLLAKALASAHTQATTQDADARKHYMSTLLESAKTGSEQDQFNYDAAKHLSYLSHSQDAVGISEDNALVVTADGIGSSGALSQVVSKGYVDGILDAYKEEPPESKEDLSEFVSYGLQKAFPESHISASSTLTVTWIDYKNRLCHTLQFGDGSLKVHDDSTGESLQSQETTYQETPLRKSWQAVPVQFEPREINSDLIPETLANAEIHGPIIQSFPLPENGYLIQGSDGVFDNKTRPLNDVQEACKQALSSLQGVSSIVDPHTDLDPPKTPLYRLAVKQKRLDELKAELTELSTTDQGLRPKKLRKRMSLRPSADQASQDNKSGPSNLKRKNHDDRIQVLREQIEVLETEIHTMTEAIDTLSADNQHYYDCLGILYRGLIGEEPNPKTLSSAIDDTGLHLQDLLEKEEDPVDPFSINDQDRALLETCLAKLELICNKLTPLN